MANYKLVSRPIHSLGTVRLATAIHLGHVIHKSMKMIYDSSVKRLLLLCCTYLGHESFRSTAPCTMEV